MIELFVAVLLLAVFGVGVIICEGIRDLKLAIGKIESALNRINTNLTDINVVLRKMREALEVQVEGEKEQ
jgi:hypothetical protein